MIDVVCKYCGWRGIYGTDAEDRYDPAARCPCCGAAPVPSYRPQGGQFFSTCPSTSLEPHPWWETSTSLPADHFSSHITLRGDEEFKSYIGEPPKHEPPPKRKDDDSGDGGFPLMWPLIMP
jgi:hypothetical protein